MSGEWGEENEVEVTAELISGYTAAIGEQPEDAAAAPPMFAVVYAAPAIWQAVIATVAGQGPLIHVAQEFEWFVPVRAGDRISTSVRLEAETVQGERRLLRFCSLSRNHAREPVSRGHWTILAPAGER